MAGNNEKKTYVRNDMGQFVKYGTIIGMAEKYANGRGKTIANALRKYKKQEK